MVCLVALKSFKGEILATFYDNFEPSSIWMSKKPNFGYVERHRRAFFPRIGSNRPGKRRQNLRYVIRIVSISAITLSGPARRQNEEHMSTALWISLLAVAVSLITVFIGVSKSKKK